MQLSLQRIRSSRFSRFIKRQKRTKGHLQVASMCNDYSAQTRPTCNVYNIYELMQQKRQFTIYVKCTLQCNRPKRQSLLSDLPNLWKLVKSVVLDGKLFRVLKIRLLKKVISSIVSSLVTNCACVLLQRPDGL